MVAGCVVESNENSIACKVLFYKPFYFFSMRRIICCRFF